MPGSINLATGKVHPQNVRFQNVKFQNVRFTKRQVYKMPGLRNVRSSKRPVPKNIYKYSVLVFGGNPQVLLQPCLQASDGRVLFSISRGFFTIYSHNP
jgi:hypothetical protein